MKREIHAHNYGIDALRILSMFYMVLLHSLTAGGILDAAEPNSIIYIIGWFLATWSYCAVDIFGIISGYVCYSETIKDHQYTSYIKLWLEVVFYNIVATTVMYMIHPDSFNLHLFISNFFPVTMNLYWYFTAYTALYVVMPLVNAGIRGCSVTTLKKLLVLILLLFSVYETMSHKFGTNGGYIFVWLLMLYIVGAIIKKCGFPKSLRIIKSIILILLLVSLSVAWKVIGFEFDFCGLQFSCDMLISYTSPTIILIALIHVLYATDIKLSSKAVRAVKYLSSGTFAVYILNCQRYIWQYVMTGSFAPLIRFPIYIVVFCVFSFSALFTVWAIIIDIIRQKLFFDFRIDSFAQFSNNILQRLLSKIGI